MPSRLSEALAWDIALTWRASLRSRVALVTDRAGVESRIVKSYQWIRLDVRSAEDAAHARAAVAAWFWLSCCPGFSGLENPHFWKRVFCELREPTAQDAPCSEPISDAVRFFDVRGSAFPRVQFDYVDAAATRRSHSRSGALRSFLGLRTHDFSSETTKTLAAIFDKLERHIDPSRMQRAIPMSVHEADFPTVRALLESQAPATAALPRLEPLARARSSSTWTPEQASERVRRTVPNYFHSLFTNTPHHETGIRAFSRLRLERDRLAPNLIQRVCSAGAHSRSIHTLNLKTTIHRARYDSRTSLSVSERVSYPEFSRMEWAWIGFALFHPEAQRSALRHLKIGLHGINREAIEILRLMKRGNHLHTIASGSFKAASRLYHIAQLKEGSIVRSTASEKGEQLLVSRGDLRVTLCVDSISNLSSWIRAAVPGIGLAWVRSVDIADITSVPPSSSQLESLHIELESASESSAALAFVRVVGASLRHLDISACGDLRASKLRVVLEACPHLSSLCVKHDGSLWTSRDTDALPILRELRLSLPASVFHPPSAAALSSSMRKLSVLQVVAEKPCFGGNKASILNMLDSHGAIEYFYWSDSSRSTRRTFVNGLALAREQLGELPKRGLRERQALAFLSVVRAMQGTPSALGAQNSDVAANILEFAADRTARTYWIDGQ